MEQAELEQIIEQARLDRSSELCLNNCQIKNLPDSVGNLSNLQSLYLNRNHLTSIPKSIGNLSKLTRLELNLNGLTSLPPNIGNLSNLIYLDLYGNDLNILPDDIGKLTQLIDLNLLCNRLTSLPGNIGNLSNLTHLDLGRNQLNRLPKSIANLHELTWIDLHGNQLTDLSSLQSLPNLEAVEFFVIGLPRRYWTTFSEWKPNWILDENNAEIRRILIKHLGYEKICQELGAFTLDTWREYSLLKIDGVEAIYDDLGWQPIDREPMLLLKMTCPSTAHIHILRVPPEMTSAEAAITWINHGIHPDEFAIQT
jgi:leucine-rich repeat protein SHOC2